MAPLPTPASVTGAGSSDPASRPSSAFESLAFQQQEDAAIWTRVWVCVGFAAEIPEPGDILPFTVGNHGIHVERLADGTLAGRFNKAQHGGCRAVPLQCQTGTKTKCSFTSCGYSRDRKPIAASDPSRELYLDQYLGRRPERLLSVAVRTWGPMILVQLDPSSDVALAVPAPETVMLADQSGATTPVEWIEVETNWKAVAIGFAPPGGTAFGDSHAVTAQADGLKATVLFPNVLILASAEASCVVVLQPTGLRKTLCRLQTFCADTDAAAGDLRDRAHAWLTSGAFPGATTEPSPACQWFQNQVRRAVDWLDAQDQTATLYRTNDKGGW